LAVERLAVAGLAVERGVVEREPLREDAVEDLRVLRVVEREEEFLVTAPRSLSNSLSAAVLVFLTLRWSPASVAVTSL
jgi:hypothetical protein